MQTGMLSLHLRGGLGRRICSVIAMVVIHKAPMVNTKRGTMKYSRAGRGEHTQTVPEAAQDEGRAQQNRGMI